MFYYLYQITNIVNGKIYVGVHKTQNLDDGYMGSGRIIRSAIQKYGLANFSKVILEFFENAELMYAREKEVVNDEFLLREDVYNLRRGGNGGFDYINRITSSRDKSNAAKHMIAKYGCDHMKNIASAGARKVVDEKLGFHSFEKYSYEDRVKNYQKRV